MAHLFQPTIIRFYDAQGRQVRKGTTGAKRVKEKCATWWGRLRDGQGKKKRVALCDDFETAESMLADLVKQSRREWSGDADPYGASRLKPLSEHIDDFERHLVAENNSDQHVFKVISYLRRTADACGWKFLGNIKSEDLANYLHERRQPSVVTQVSVKDLTVVVSEAMGLASPPTARIRRLTKRFPKPDVAAQRGIAARWSWSKVRSIVAKEFACELPERCPLPADVGMSIAASNDYVAACKNFGNWLTKTRPKRWPENPLSPVGKLNADEDVRRERRPASVEEFQRLVAAARLGEPFRGLSGVDRAMLYVVAVYTGFRASELGSLRALSFQLDADPPMIVVQAEHSKRRRKDEQPIRPDLAALLREWLRERQAVEPPSQTLSLNRAGRGRNDDRLNPKLWPGSWVDDAAEMLRVDLAAAGIEHEDSAGRVLDFHALRHSFASWLSKAGVAPKAAQELMRHSDIRLTMKWYTSLEVRDLTNDLDRLPPVPWSGFGESSVMRATGTDCTGREFSWTKSCTRSSQNQPFTTVVSENGLAAMVAGSESKRPSNPAGAKGLCGSLIAAEKEPSVGFEPTTYALRKHRSAD